MTSPLYLEKAAATPQETVPGTSPSLGGLPPDILREGASRLGYASLVYSVVFFLAFYGTSVFSAVSGTGIPEYVRGPRSVIALFSIALGLVTFWLTRRQRINPTFLLDFGLCFQVIGALGIAATTVYGVYPVWEPEMLAQSGQFTGIPWECVWIVIYPILCPNTPGKTLLAGLAAASMGPLLILISKATGATSAEAPLSFFADYYLFTTYLCAFIAFLGSRIVMRYGMRLKEARQVGNYQLVERLGQGGMGEVWLARHRMLARPAAIKLIRPEALGLKSWSGDGENRDDPDEPDDRDDRDHRSPPDPPVTDPRSILRRFEREARATAALRSVHTIDIFDFGTTDGGAFYYVMELLDGLDLDALVKRFGPVPAGRAIWLLRQACHSLQEAHENGLIHRDIKPANLYVCRMGPDRDFIKVLDFGLVKTAGELAGDTTQLTRQGILFGTPSCMPPEMAAGPGRVDGRADLYSLGCVGYWLLTGQPVFPGESALTTVLHHVNDPPVPPSERTECEVPADLEEVILACLAKNPAGRPGTAAELERRLAACTAAGRWDRDQADRWWDLHLPTDTSPLRPGPGHAVPPSERRRGTPS